MGPEEDRYALARAIFHGRHGEVRRRYREGQEDQLSALGLVTNAVVLWNTRYQQAALDALRAEGHDVRDEDVARLSGRSMSGCSGGTTSSCRGRARGAPAAPGPRRA